MRLTKLKPHWVTLANWADKTVPFYVGVTFLCPHCEEGPCPHCGKDQGKRLAVNFWPPIDPTNAAAKFSVPIPDNGGHRRVSGETFDTLTLSPPIGFDSPPHFHGNITNGEITNTPAYPDAAWTKE